MNLKNLIKILVSLISFSGITRVFFSTQTYATTLSLVINYICIGILFFMIYKLPPISIDKKKLLWNYFIYATFILGYSLVVSNSYEQTRYVFTVFVPSLVLPIIAMLSSKPIVMAYFLKYFLIISIPLSILLYFSEFEGMSDFTHYVSFIYILILFIPYIKKKWKVVIIAFSILSFFYSFESRSNLLNISFVCVLLLFHFYNSEKKKKILKAARIVFVFLPIIFVLSAILGNFNIFSFGDEFKDSYSLKRSDGTKISLSNDSRTGIYIDALSGIVDNNAYIFGLSAAGYNKTSLKDVELDNNEEYYKNGRLGSESGMLEYLLRGGFVFVLIITLIHYYASKYALYDSNNNLCNLLGVYIAFRYMFLFIEAQPGLDLSNISTFIIIGLCLSGNFRRLSDEEIKYHLKRII